MRTIEYHIFINRNDNFIMAHTQVQHKEQVLHLYKIQVVVCEIELISSIYVYICNIMSIKFLFIGEWNTLWFTYFLAKQQAVQVAMNADNPTNTANMTNHVPGDAIILATAILFLTEHDSTTLTEYFA